MTKSKEIFTDFDQLYDAVLQKQYEKEIKNIDIQPRKKFIKFKIKGKRFTDKTKKRLWMDWCSLSPKKLLQLRTKLKSRKKKRKGKRSIRKY